MNDTRKPLSETWIDTLHGHPDNEREVTRQIAALERELKEAKQEIKDHAKWAAEYGKTPDGEAYLKMNKRALAAERELGAAINLRPQWQARAQTLANELRQAERRAQDAERLAQDNWNAGLERSERDGKEIVELKAEIARLKAEKASAPVAMRDRPLVIPVSMRLPIQEDANDCGRVGVYEGGIWDTYPWDELPDRASAWARIPDKPCSCEGSGCELCNWRRIDNHKKRE
jgi:hypothetical protein